MTKKVTLDEIESLEMRERASFINKLSGYKSPVLIGTKSAKSITNISLFSNVFHLGSHPGLIGMISRPNTVEKHTIENIIETKSYSLNYSNASMIEEVHHCSARYPREVSEFDKTEFTEIYEDGFHAPLIKESSLSLLMKLEEVIDIKINGTHLIIGSIQRIMGVSAKEVPDFKFEDYSNLVVSGLDTYFETSFKSSLPYAKARS